MSVAPTTRNDRSSSLVSVKLGACLTRREVPQKGPNSSALKGPDNGRGENAEPFQDLGMDTHPTQSCASLALGFDVRPRWGQRLGPKSAAYQPRLSRTAAPPLIAKTLCGLAARKLGLDTWSHDISDRHLVSEPGEQQE